MSKPHMSNVLTQKPRNLKNVVFFVHIRPTVKASENCEIKHFGFVMWSHMSLAVSAVNSVFPQPTEKDNPVCFHTKYSCLSLLGSSRGPNPSHT